MGLERDFEIQSDSQVKAQNMATRYLGLSAISVLIAFVACGCNQEPPPRVFESNFPAAVPEKKLPVVSVPDSIEELLEAIDAAFPAEAPPASSPVLVFPLTDEKGQIIQDGESVSEIANTMISFQPDRRFAIPVRFVHKQLFAEAGCNVQGQRLDEAQIEACRAAVGARLFVVASVRPIASSSDKEALVLTVKCHGGEDRNLEATFEHELPLQAALDKMPGLIATDALKQLGQELSDAEANALIDGCHQLAELAAHRRWPYGRDPSLPNSGSKPTQPQFPYQPGNERQQFETEYSSKFNEPWWLDCYFSKWPDPESIKAGLLKYQPDERYSYLPIALAKAMSKDPEEAVMRMLSLSSRHRNDIDYWSALLTIGQRTNDPRMLQRLLDRWREADSSYLAHLARGEKLVKLAWEARGDGYASSVTEEGFRFFGQHLDSAREELEAAVELNPTGCWQAAASLISVGMGLGLPREYVDAHFSRAVEVFPAYKNAWSSMYQYLQPRWHGSDEELLAFAVRAVQSEQWDAGVSDLMRNAILEVGGVASARSLSAEFCRNKGVFDAVREFNLAAERSGGELDKRTAQGLLLRVAVLGEHHAAAASAVASMPDDFETPDFAEYGESQYYKSGAIKYYKSIVLAKAGEGVQRTLAQARIALADTRIDDATALLNNLRSNDEGEQSEIERLERASKLAVRLFSERSLQLTPEEILESFDCDLAGWEVQSDALVTTLHKPGTSVLTCPFGIPQGRVSMTLTWDDPAGHRNPNFLLEHVNVLLDSPSINRQQMVSYLPLWPKGVLNGPGRALADCALPAGTTQHFVAEFRPGRHKIEPCPGVEWKVPTDSTMMSGFAVRLISDEEPAWLSIKNLSIEVFTDDDTPSGASPASEEESDTEE